MKILITGGLGYLGGRLSSYLASCGHDVVIGTSRNVALPENLSTCTLKFVNYDNSESLREACKDVEVVVHAAGMNSQDSEKSCTNALLVNGLCTSLLVDAAIYNRVRRFIYISTAHVYSHVLQGDIAEDNCTRNIHPYATSHVAGENALLYKSMQGEIQGVVLRLGNAFGYPQTSDVNCWELFANYICKSVSLKESVEIKSDPNTMRNFIAIADFCVVLHEFCRVRNDLWGEIYNVGSAFSMSLLDITSYIIDRARVALGTPTVKPIIRKSSTAPIALNFNINKMLDLGIVPNNCLNVEIDETLRYCVSNFNA